MLFVTGLGSSAKLCEIASCSALCLSCALSLLLFLCVSFSLISGQPCGHGHPPVNVCFVLFTSWGIGGSWCVLVLSLSSD